MPTAAAPDPVRDAYDAAAASRFPGTTARQAIAARAAGPAAPLKRFHNAVKRDLIGKFVARGDRVLDLACGRGGDLGKWAAAGVREVVCVDVSPASVAEAARRHAESFRGLNATFRVGDMRRHDDDDGFDAAACNFALHYAFGDADGADRAIGAAARALRPGGVFFGVAADGDAVAATHDFAGPQSSLLKAWTGPPRDFGAAYCLVIADTVVSAGAPEEYLVRRGVLGELAARHGLEPVDVRGVRGVAPGGILHGLDPPGWVPEGLARASRLYAAFAFRKVRVPR